jgi:hypothetical protein
LEEIRGALRPLTVDQRLTVETWLRELDGIAIPANQVREARPAYADLEEYVLVAQDERRVTVYPRAEAWKPRVCGGLDASVELSSIDLTAPLSEVYWDVPFS